MTTTILTDEQIMHLWDTRVGDPTECMPLVDSDKTAFARAIEQAVLQSEQVQAWKKDAERYRWLRNDCLDGYFGEIAPVVFNTDDCFKHDDEALIGEDLDDAIDAAMEKRR